MNSALATSSSFQGILAFLPMLPWEGPPLPRVMGLRWPWALSFAGPQKVEDYFRGTFEFTNGRQVLGAPEQEETEIIRGEGGGIVKLIKRRLPGGGGG